MITVASSPIFTGRLAAEVEPRFRFFSNIPEIDDQTAWFAGIRYDMPVGARTLLRVTVVDPEAVDPKAGIKETADLVERLMGRKPELRFAFIQEHARFVEEIDV